ncbi:MULTISPECIES: phage holin [unclassified Vibrio]|uniref:phage holin n=1 Tax=unclassified Vibrio TaxID=2614977 RepID=UPI0013613F7E|nr:MULTISPECIES: phage holin [unclassified Vibrio]NAW57179.1 hypothetical protein [Vibrio sp. V36_P2S2PM302]NAX20991.1 hypothetical protein [Vibrio sp. V39_P1S14PM300]NAX27622.1 hypothetical protein [Vibrio sp. V38_P2S17PM301]NAX29408.1 hypothetical protein [Vibrio sp. V37_P2S8PM304]
MRMLEKLSSAIAYGWCAFLAAISAFFSFVSTITPDWWVAISSIIGTIVTTYINYHFRKKQAEREMHHEQHQK